MALRMEEEEEEGEKILMEMAVWRVTAAMERTMAVEWGKVGARRFPLGAARWLREAGARERVAEAAMPVVEGEGTPPAAGAAMPLVEAEGTPPVKEAAQ